MLNWPWDHGDPTCCMSFTRSLAIWVDGYSMVFILCQTWCGQFSKTSVQVLRPNKRCPATSSPVLRAGRWTLHGESLSRTSLAIGKHAYVVAWRACVQWWQTSEVVWWCLWLNEERIYLTVTLGHYSPRVSKSLFFPILKWYKFGNVSDLNINRHIFSRNDISIYFPKCKTLRIQRWFHFPSKRRSRTVQHWHHQVPNAAEQVFLVESVETFSVSSAN
jgi:hypothetical protein